MRKLGDSMLRNIKFASVGMFGDSLMTLPAMSLMELIVASNSLSVGTSDSVKTFTAALKKGSSVINSFTLNRSLPCRITVVLPSGMRSIFKILATVPT